MGLAEPGSLLGWAGLPLPAEQEPCLAECSVPPGMLPRGLQLEGQRPPAAFLGLQPVVWSPGRGLPEDCVRAALPGQAPIPARLLPAQCRATRAFLEAAAVPASGGPRDMVAGQGSYRLNQICPRQS